MAYFSSGILEASMAFGFDHKAFIVGLGLWLIGL